MVVAMRTTVSSNVTPCGVVDTNVEEKCAAFIFSKDEYDRSSQMWALYNCAHLSFLTHIWAHKKDIILLLKTFKFFHG
jgi:hypothetical protein